MSYLFTSESVSEGHPDKVADQISDALIDNFLAFDPESKVACETLVTTGQVFLAGEVKSKAYLDVQKIAREVINKIIMDELVYGVFKPESVTSFQRIMLRMKENDCDAVVLGCTEIPLLMNDANSPLPTLDSTCLLARAALNRAVEKI